MRINTQFPMALHILAMIVYLKEVHPDRAATSTNLAKSVGTNPVVIRRIIPSLKKAGLIDAKAGVKGITLCKNPGDISLLDIYDAVRQDGDIIFDIHPNPNPNCKVGGHIENAVTPPLMSAQKAMEKELSTFTLKDIMKTIWEKNNMLDKI